MRSRSVRRHHAQRIKRRVLGYHGGYATRSSRARGRAAHTAQHCSCFMCGNPRRYFGEVTLQERRADAADADQSGP